MVNKRIIGAVIVLCCGIFYLVFFGLILGRMLQLIIGGIWSFAGFIYVIVIVSIEVGSSVTYPKEPQTANDFYLLGMQYYNSGRDAEALEFFNKALELDQNNAWYWIHKGGILEKLGNLEEAIECFEHALQIEPSNSMAKNNIERLRKV